MFGTVLDKLNSWLGQAYLFSRFIPCLVFCVMNLALLYLTHAGLRQQIEAGISNITAASGAAYLVLALGTVAVFAYTITPLVRIVTAFLEGDWLLADNKLRWLGKSLVYAKSREQIALFERRDRLFRERTQLPELDDVIARLAAAREAGESLRTIANPEAIREAERLVHRLRREQYLRRPLDKHELETALQVLSAALSRNCAETRSLRPPITDAKRDAAERLTRLQDEITGQIAPYAAALARDQEAKALDRSETLFSKAQMAPTRLGNLAAALRDYCDTRYGIDFDTFWPRFLLAIQKNDKLSSGIANAKIQLDFAIMSLALTFATAALWIAGLALFGPRGLPLFAALAAILPVTRFWLWVVHASYAEFAEVVKGAIDLGRFDLLGMLHHPLPPTLEAERRIWGNLAQLAISTDLPVNLAYRHPAA